MINFQFNKIYKNSNVLNRKKINNFLKIFKNNIYLKQNVKNFNEFQLIKYKVTKVLWNKYKLKVGIYRKHAYISYKKRMLFKKIRDMILKKIIFNEKKIFYLYFIKYYYYKFNFLRDNNTNDIFNFFLFNKYFFFKNNEILFLKFYNFLVYFNLFFFKMFKYKLFIKTFLTRYKLRAFLSFLRKNKKNRFNNNQKMNYINNKFFNFIKFPRFKFSPKFKLKSKNLKFKKYKKRFGFFYYKGFSLKYKRFIKYQNYLKKIYLYLKLLNKKLFYTNFVKFKNIKNTKLLLKKNVYKGLKKNYIINILYLKRDFINKINKILKTYFLLINFINSYVYFKKYIKFRKFVLKKKIRLRFRFYRYFLSRKFYFKKFYFIDDKILQQINYFKMKKYQKIRKILKNRIYNSNRILPNKVFKFLKRKLKRKIYNYKNFYIFVRLKFKFLYLKFIIKNNYFNKFFLRIKRKLLNKKKLNLYKFKKLLIKNIIFKMYYKYYFIFYKYKIINKKKFLFSFYLEYFTLNFNKILLKYKKILQRKNYRFSKIFKLTSLFLNIKKYNSFYYTLFATKKYKNKINLIFLKKKIFSFFYIFGIK